MGVGNAVINFGDERPRDIVGKGLPLKVHEAVDDDVGSGNEGTATAIADDLGLALGNGTGAFHFATNSSAESVGVSSLDGEDGDGSSNFSVAVSRGAE